MRLRRVSIRIAVGILDPYLPAARSRLHVIPKGKACFTILGNWKALGAIVITAPGLPRLKEWASAGIVFELTGAAAPYVLHGEITSDLITPFILATLAIASWPLRPASRTLACSSRSERARSHRTTARMSIDIDTSTIVELS